MNTLEKQKGESQLDELRQKIAIRLGKISKNTALLMDLSGSMSGQPEIQLRNLAKKFKYVRRFYFNSWVEELKPMDEIPLASGGTDMAKAFSHVKQKGITRIVLMTDGVPDSKEEAFDKSDGLHIDVIYIGPEPIPEFLRKLANHTGGKFDTGTLDIPMELEEKITRLLPAPGESGIKL